MTAGRAIFIDRDEPLDVSYTYLQLASAGTERQIRYIYLDSTGVVLESTTDPTNIGIGYLPLAMVDVWTGTTEITQDKIKDIRPRAGAEESNSNAQDNHELSGNVTLHSPDTGNDSFIVAATKPAGLKVDVTSGRALVSGEMLNAEGGLLDVTSHRNIVKEFIAFSDGREKTFHLYHKSVSNVVVYVNDVITPVTVDATNGSIVFAAVPIQDGKITASYTFSGDYMLIFLVERAQTNDGKAFGVINWKVGSNRSALQPPDLPPYQHGIAKVDMSSAITAITDAIIDNSYEVKNLTQYDLQYGGKLDGSSLKSGAISLGKLDSSIQSSIGAIGQLKTEIDTTMTAIENSKQDITVTRQELSAKYTELIQATSELSKKDQSLTSTIAGNKTEMESKLNSAVSQIKQTTDNIATTVVSNKKDADDKNKANLQQISQIQQSVDSISSTVSVNQSDADSKISTIKQTVDGIFSTVSANKTDADGKISSLKQTADSIASMVATNKTDMEGKLNSTVSKIQQFVDSISSTVSVNKADTDSKISTIKQTADSITSIITELGKPIDQCSYTAISQGKDAINLRVKSSDFNGKNMVSQINISPAGTLIDGNMLHVTGQTVFDDNVIVGRMLQAGSVDAAKITVGAVTADKIAAGAITAGKIATNSITSEKMSAEALNLTSNGKALHAGAVTLDNTGMKITEASGAYTKFDSDGIKWYKNNIPYAAVRRMVQGSASNGQYVRLNWDKTPLILLGPRSIQTTVPGYDNTSLRFIVEPYEVSSAGFRVRAVTAILSGKGSVPYGNIGTANMLGSFDSHGRPAGDAVAVLSQIISISINTTSLYITYSISLGYSYEEQITSSAYANRFASGSCTLKIEYKAASSNTWITFLQQNYSGTNTCPSYDYTVGVNLIPNVYDFRISMLNAISSRVSGAISFNGGGVIANNNEVSFLAMESDENNYYSIE